VAAGVGHGRDYRGVVHVKCVRSGGLAGLELVATLDATDLSADQQGLLAGLLTADVHATSPSRPGGADQFSYQLEIHHGGRIVRYRWEEPEVPETVRPLLAGLMSRAEPAH
jgi:hypothetical protein